uniref:Tetraspanin n=1 Tax=Timema tahoe TaxID=61484 RepID=A0A7R9NZF9_9NEOP|nr:unnamed protein product [Timema tahoe]
MKSPERFRMSGVVIGHSAPGGSGTKRSRHSAREIERQWGKAPIRDLNPALYMTHVLQFAVLLLVIFIVELAVGIAAAVNKNEVNSVLKTALRKSLGNSTHSSDVDRKAWDEMQMKVGRDGSSSGGGCGLRDDGGNCWLSTLCFLSAQLKCCGVVESWLDWEDVSIPPINSCCPDLIAAYPSYLKCCGVESWQDWENVSIPLPASCCPDPPSAPLRQTCKTPATVYTAGCYDTLKIKVKDGAIVIMGVGIGLAFIQFVGIVFAFCLASAIKKGEEK